MNLVHRFITYLWWGPFRRPFEALVRRLRRGSSIILSGPLRGMYFDGGLAQNLGIYEPFLQGMLAQHLSGGGIFYDIGANNGFFTLFASSMVGSTGQVYAFEPLPQNISSLKTHIQKNNLLNCFVIEQAVSDINGTAELFHSGNIATPSIMKKGNNESSLLIQTITLDEFVKTHPIPSLIKLDIEGAEGTALKGSETLLKNQNAPSWIIEVHDSENDQIIKALLAGADFKISKLKHPRKKASQYPYHLFAYKDA